MEIRVECTAGYRGEETPRRMVLSGNGIRVQAVIDRWLAPDHRYFKVLGEDGGVYILRHDAQRWAWELVSYRAGA